MLLLWLFWVLSMVCCVLRLVVARCIMLLELFLLV